MIGRLLAHYKIVEKLGEGGMGVVYKARDTHLDRFVAIKVLPPEKVADSDRKRRFVQEAKAASALNHPNIVTVYDVSEAEGVTFMAMECVEGKTLDQLLARKGLKLNDVLRCAIQVAGALSKAHKAGIVHRDLKPSNVMATGDGVVKVLDFGLAKLTEPAVESDAETTATIADDARPRTAEGQLLGTIAYMSPEQAEGRAVDGRSDIFSFGALLYEMATGQRAFQGDSRVSILAAILREDPKPASSISGQVPRELEKIIARCLRKDAARRYQNMEDVRLALEELKEESESGALGAPAAAAPRRTRRLALAGVATALLVTAAAAWYWYTWKAPRSLPELVRLSYDSGLTTDPALSPDERLLAYASDRAGEGHLDIWVQQLAGGEPVRITREPADDSEPHFSPDGTQIAFRSDRAGGGIYVVSALGGEARLIATEGRRPRFSPDGAYIAFWKGSPTSGSPWMRGAASIWVAPANGGAPRQIALESAIAANPEWTPDGKNLVFAGLPKSPVNPAKELDFWVAPVDGGPAVGTGVREAVEKQSLRYVDNYPALAAGGEGLFYLPLAQGSSINVWRVALSPRTWRVEGTPHRVSQGAETHVQPSAVGADIAFAATSRSVQIWGMKLDASRGRTEGEPQQITHGANCYIPTLSADGSKMSFLSFRSGTTRAVVREMASGREVVVAGSKDIHHPVLSQDGSKLAYRIFNEAGAADTLVAQVSGGMPEKVCTDCEMLHQWSRDGNRILYSHGGGIGLLDIPAKTQRVLYERPSNRMIWQAQFSPDERWISFIVNVDSTRKSLHIAPASGGLPPEKWITVAPAECENDKPRWSPDGSLLYFTSNRDGARCVWAQRLDAATKRPVGDAFAVFHSHSASLSLGNVPLYPLEMAVAPGRLVFVLGEVRANIWMTQVR